MSLLLAGSVAVDDAGSESGSGFALDLYRAMRDAHDAAQAALDRPLQVFGPARLASLKIFAAMANGHATVLAARTLREIDLDQVTSPSGPPAGKARIVVDASDGKIKAANVGGGLVNLITGGAGGISGPVSSTDNAVMRWDGAGGNAAQDSLVTIGDTGNISLPALATVDGVDVSVLDAEVDIIDAAVDGLLVDVAALEAHPGTGGSAHAAATGSVAGFMSAADKTKLDAFPASAVPTSRTITAGAGMTGTGDLSADRTLAIGANADGSIIVNADDIQVGVLATDAQHGARGGGTQHANVVAGGAAGFMTGADKTKLDGASAAWTITHVAAELIG